MIIRDGTTRHLLAAISPMAPQADPLVTFVIITYNQENHIKEAIQSALAQTYEPMKVLVSDDFSQDNTYAVAEEALLNSGNGKNVTIRQNKKNMGLIEHLRIVVSEINTPYALFASGDDISRADRTKISMDFLLKKNCVLFHSNVDFIDVSGKELVNVKKTPTFHGDYSLADVATSTSLYIGATCAIDMSLYREFNSISNSNCYEDLILGFRAALIGEIGFCPEPLVRYRVDTGISYKNKLGSSKEKRYKALTRSLAVYEQRLQDLQISHPDQLEIAKILNQKIYEVKSTLAFEYNKPYYYVRYFPNRVIKKFLVVVKGSSN